MYLERGIVFIMIRKDLIKVHLWYNAEVNRRFSLSTLPTANKISQLIFYKVNHLKRMACKLPNQMQNICSQLIDTSYSNSFGDLGYFILKCTYHFDKHHLSHFIHLLLLSDKENSACKCILNPDIKQQLLNGNLMSVRGLASDHKQTIDICSISLS